MRLLCMYCLLDRFLTHGTSEGPTSHTLVSSQIGCQAEQSLFQVKNSMISSACNPAFCLSVLQFWLNSAWLKLRFSNKNCIVTRWLVYTHLLHCISAVLLWADQHQLPHCEQSCSLVHIWQLNTAEHALEFSYACCAQLLRCEQCSTCMATSLMTMSTA